jgi:hypothetical protein
MGRLYASEDLKAEGSLPQGLPETDQLFYRPITDDETAIEENPLACCSSAPGRLPPLVTNMPPVNWQGAFVYCSSS